MLRSRSIVLALQALLFLSTFSAGCSTEAPLPSAASQLGDERRTLGSAVCPGATLTASSGGGTIDLSAWGDCLGQPLEFRFLTQPPGATAYGELRSWGPASTASLSTTGLVAGRHYFMVYVRPAGSSAYYEAYATAALTVGSVCTDAALNVTRGTGSSIDLTAAATCPGGTAEYRFMRRAPGASVYSEVRGWGAGGATTFDTAGLVSGQHEFVVYARAAGNSSIYEAHGWVTYEVGTVCTAGALAATQGTGSFIDLSAAATCAGATAEFRFMTRPPGAADYTELRPWGTGSTATFDTTTLASGRHDFLVYIRALGNDSLYEAYGSAYFVVGSKCSTASVTATPGAGTTVSLAASASCEAATPEFRFLTQGPGEASYRELRAWGAGTSATFDTAGTSAGRRYFMVYARAAGNSSSYEAYGTASLTVGTTCTAATLSLAQAGGSLLDLNATAACAGTTPEYRFVTRAPGALSYSEVRGWGTGASATFDTAGLVSGRHEFVVYARAAGNTSIQEAWSAATWLVGTVCTGATLGATPGPGAEIELTASSSCGGGTPEYRFLARAPGASTYTEIRPWGPSPVFAWNTAGLAVGEYSVAVHTRVAGSGSVYEAGATTIATVTELRCATATLSASQLRGPLVTLGATADCGGAQAEYQFLTRDTYYGTFTELRGYSPEPAFEWDTGPLAPRDYELWVNVRVMGSAVASDASASTTYTVTGCVASECSPGEVQCRDGGLLSCEYMSDGCYYYGQPTPCSTGACGSTTMCASPPEVVAFASAPRAIRTGSTRSVTWSWSYRLPTLADTSCSIDNGVGPMVSGASAPVTLAQDAAFTLTCTNALGSSQATLTIPTVDPITQVTSVGLGGGHTCAITSAGTLKCWGFNSAGCLGPNAGMEEWTPVDVTGLAGYPISVVGGAGHTCALLSGGTVQCWGRNTRGQLGIGAPATGSTSVPQTVPVTGVTRLAAGGSHQCALTASGTVKCWGYNDYGAVSSSAPFSTQNLPVDVAGLGTGVRSIAAGDNHSCAVTSAGGVKCWGNDYFGQLGDGTPLSSGSTVDVIGLGATVAKVVAGGAVTCALTTSGGVKCWGGGYLGNSSAASSTSPVDVTGLSSGVNDIDANGNVACALTSTGGLKCWGWNSRGEVGDGTKDVRLDPVDVPDLASGVIGFELGGGGHGCAVLNSGALKCWGANPSGQLGDGSNEEHLYPDDVLVP